jgi:hypothetical protein
LEEGGEPSRRLFYFLPETLRIRIAWMDQRNEPHWNVYYRTSPDGGSTWSGETVLSTFVTGYTYIFVDGFRFPFGDYFDMDIDNKSHTQTARQGEDARRCTPCACKIGDEAFRRAQTQQFFEDKPMRAANRIGRVARLELYGALWFVVASQTSAGNAPNVGWWSYAPLGARAFSPGIVLIIGLSPCWCRGLEA